MAAAVFAGRVGRQGEADGQKRDADGGLGGAEQIAFHDGPFLQEWR